MGGGVEQREFGSVRRRENSLAPASIYSIYIEDLTIKYVKGDISIRDNLNKNVSQRELGSHRPHGTEAGLNTRKNVRST